MACLCHKCGRVSCDCQLHETIEQLKSSQATFLPFAAVKDTLKPGDLVMVKTAKGYFGGQLRSCSEHHLWLKNGKFLTARFILSVCLLKEGVDTIQP